MFPHLHIWPRGLLPFHLPSNLNLPPFLQLSEGESEDLQRERPRDEGDEEARVPA